MHASIIFLVYIVFKWLLSDYLAVKKALLAAFYDAMVQDFEGKPKITRPLHRISGVACSIRK